MDIRGVYRFSSLVKQNKKAKNCAVFCFAGGRGADGWVDEWVDIRGVYRVIGLALL
jgi:hypothetical protein